MSPAYVELYEALDHAARDRVEREKKQASLAADSQVVVALNWWAEVRAP